MPKVCLSYSLAEHGGYTHLISKEEVKDVSLWHQVKNYVFGGIKDMLDFIKSRRSTRKFKNEAVPAELVEQVVEAGRYAPSGGNSYNVTIRIIM